MRREILLSVLAVALGGRALVAQNSVQETLNPVNTAPGGLRLLSVSGFMTYYSGSISGLAGGGETGTGGSASFGFTGFRERTGISITYTPTYSADFHGYGAKSSSLSHSLSLSWRRNLTPKLAVTFSTAGVVSSVTEAVFMPTATANLAGAPGSFDELSAGLTAGRLTNGPLAAILTGAQVVQSPAGLRLYGSRFLSSSVLSSISYSRSSRLTFYVNMQANRSQTLKDSSVPAVSRPGYQLAHTTAGLGSISMSYSLTPRTQLSGSWSTSRTFSNLQDAYSNSAGVSLAHTMFDSWFWQVNGGIGFISAVREYYALPKGLQYQTGGGIGYRKHAHTFLASVDRSIGDTYGLGAGVSVSATGAWSWSSPASSWSTTAGFGQQWLTGKGFNSFNTWRATAGLRRRAGQHMSVLTEYAYLSGAYSVLGPSLLGGGQHMVRISVVWSPNGQAAGGH